MYELEVYQQGEKPQVYQFDNIDMVAIEIYDIISDTYKRYCHMAVPF